MHSGLTGQEIDRYVLQQEAKEGWQWYVDVDLRPWHCLITSWRVNAHCRPTTSPIDLFLHIARWAIYVAIFLLLWPFVLVRSALGVVAQRLRWSAADKPDRIQ